ncbi:SUKH-4 family immunity protein [Streptomyces naphthomycinicus]|uniref:SUKH-4 family immunity protein n=1 Tax=Streptomyces naphthomycinicus TaxID=2872625 RepID=UPI00308371B2
MACTLWLIHHERTIDAHLGHELATDAYDHLVAAMIHALNTLDPTGTLSDSTCHYWTELFQDETGGLL